MKHNFLSCLFGFILIGIGILNIILVDYRPGILYILLSVLYFVPMDFLSKNRKILNILTIGKILLGVVSIWFTLGISDLGDMIDKL